MVLSKTSWMKKVFETLFTKDHLLYRNHEIPHSLDPLPLSFLFNFLIIFTFRNYFTLCKIVLCNEEKLFFSVTIIL